MHINRCTASIYQAYSSRYKELQKTKAAKKGLLNEYSQKMISSISRLQDESLEVDESNIQRKSRGLYSSNTTAIYDTEYFSTRCSKSPESNPTNPQKVSIFFMRYNNTQKIMTSNETHITVANADLIVSESLSFNLSLKPWFKKVLALARTVSKFYQPLNRNLTSKYFLYVINDHNM